MSVQEPYNGRPGLTPCIYCGTPCAAGTRVCATHQADLHDEPPTTGGGPRA